MNTGFGMSTYGNVPEQDEEPEPIDRSTLPLTADQLCAAKLQAWKDISIPLRRQSNHPEALRSDLLEFRFGKGKHSSAFSPPIHETLPNVISFRRPEFTEHLVPGCFVDEKGPRTRA